MKSSATDTQAKIDELRRQQLIIDLLSQVIRNQHWSDSTSAKCDRAAQLELLTRAAVEDQALKGEIASLVKLRDAGRPA